MYYLKTSAAFDSAHFLSGYQGKCSNLHGHRWTIEVLVGKETLQEAGQMRGMVLDFGDLKHALRELAACYDHALIINTENWRCSCARNIPWAKHGTPRQWRRFWRRDSI